MAFCTTCAGGSSLSIQCAWSVDEMPNAVAMTKSVDAGMNLRLSTKSTIRGSAAAGQDGVRAQRPGSVVHHSGTAIHHT